MGVEVDTYGCQHRHELLWRYQPGHWWMIRRGEPHLWWFLVLWVLSAVPSLDDILLNGLLFVKEWIMGIRSSIWCICARFCGGLCGWCWKSVLCYMMIYIKPLPLSSSHQSEQPLFQHPAWLWPVSLCELTSFHYSKSAVLQTVSTWCTSI